MDKFLAKKNPIFKQVDDPNAASSGMNHRGSSKAGVSMAAATGMDKQSDQVYHGFGLVHPD